ncbi:MAG: hypothetical protein P4L83_20535 [Nevskia sp.]|nr:hypothetical protein [Nevskia sp.]
MNAMLPATIRKLIGAGCAALVLSACGTLGLNPVRDPGADKVRAELASLEADPELASRAGPALKAAEDAVHAADEPQRDPALSKHLVYIAGRKVQTARALAEARVAEDQVNALRSQRGDAPGR